MRIVQTTQRMTIRNGGAAYVLLSLCKTLRKQNVNVQLFYINSSSQGDRKLIEEIEDWQHGTKGYIFDRFRVEWLPHYKSAIIKYCSKNRVDIVHVNGLWGLTSHSGVVAARKNGIPIVFSPHGSMSRWALNHSAWKKRIAMVLYQREDLRNATVFHATAESEYEDIRRLGFTQPIAVVPNGVHIPEIEGKSIRKGRVRTMLFLSRIHVSKGLPMLIEAWSKLKLEGWKCIIAGPDEQNHRLEIESLVKKHKLQSFFEFVGQVTGKEKERVFRDCDVFILPTHSENFGVVVAEALAYSKPAITTTAAPWKELLEHKCGWWVSPNVDGIYSALKEASSTSDDLLEEMGENGRRLVVDKYGWEGIAKKMKDVYLWTMDKRNEMPSCVYL